jgi:hypothetical protein
VDWTPARDGDGNIPVTEFEKLAVYQWVRVAGNTIDSLIPSPRYPTFLGNPDGSPSVVTGWSGAAWDPAGQVMYISGGGHADSHFCENGVYALSGRSLTFSVAQARSPITAAQFYDTSTNTVKPGMTGGGAGYPLADGSVGASHTYDALIWVPPALMGNSKGGLLNYGGSKGLLDLDSGKYDTPHFQAADITDMSYKIAVMDGWQVIHPRASWYYKRYDFSQREATTYHPNSRGKALPQVTGSPEVVYNHKAFCWMRQRREFVSFAKDQSATRVRYGQAIDSGNQADWSAYHDAITLQSSDGSHLDFSAANFLDQTSVNLLTSAGAAYDPFNDVIWIQANHAGSGLYEISGLNGKVWTTRRIVGASAPTTSRNGTFGRFQVFKVGTVKLAMRVTSTTSPVEVIRLA